MAPSTAEGRLRSSGARKTTTARMTPALTRDESWVRSPAASPLAVLDRLMSIVMP